MFQSELLTGKTDFILESYQLRGIVLADFSEAFALVSDSRVPISTW